MVTLERGPENQQEDELLLDFKIDTDTKAKVK